MFGRLLVVALACAACGRVAFEARDGELADGGEDAVVDTSVDGEVPAGVVVQSAHVMLGATTVVVTIDAIDVARTVVFCDFQTATSNHSRTPTCKLTSPTTVDVEVGVADANVVVHVQVVQLPVGSQVQRGSLAFMSTQTQHSIPLVAVDTARSFAIVTRRTPSESNEYDARFAFSTELSDSTLVLTRSEVGSPADVVWQVVELAAATVQSGTFLVANGTQGGAVTVAPYDPARSFVVFGWRGGSGFEPDYALHHVLPASDTIMFVRRSAMQDVTVTWFLVEQPQVRAQHGQLQFGGLGMVSSPITPVETRRAAVLVSGSGGLPGDPSHLDSVSVMSALSSTQVSLARGTLDDSDTLGAWSVIEWE